MAEDLRADLNPEQLAGLEAMGTTLLMAGAGSGKTRVLTRKAAYLIKEHGVAPNRILALTFTNKAGNEMSERLSGLLDLPIERGSANSPWIGTIHSFFYSILREDLPRADTRYAPRITVLDDTGAKRMVEKILKDEYGIPADDAEPLTFLNAFAMAQTAGYTVDDAGPYLEEIPNGAFIHRVWQSYMRVKRQGDKYGAKYIDFSDMVTLAVKLLENHEIVLSKWQSRFDWILVDEYQDTDIQQFRGLRMLAEKHQNLFCVGDCRQLIYAWRGAEIKLTSDFMSYFPHGKVLYMTRNYRSLPALVSAGNSLISEMGLPDMEAHRTGDGRVTYLGHFGAPTDEATAVTENIQQLLSNGASPGDFAVIYRTNAQSAAVEDTLSHAGIPYVIQGSAGFYGRAEVKDMLAYMAVVHEVISGGSDEETREAVNRLLQGKYAAESGLEAFERVINRPNRYLGRAFLREWAEQLDTANPLAAMSYGHFSRSYMERNAHAWAGIITELVDRHRANPENLRQLVVDIRALTQYDAWLAKNSSDSADAVKQENLATLESRADDFTSLAEFLLYAASHAKPESENGESAKSVKLMTVHRAKGLEFPYVHVIGLSDGLLPHRYNMYDDAGLGEELRIAYVALTRAEVGVFLSGCATRPGGDDCMEPSRFLRLLNLEELSSCAAS